MTLALLVCSLAFRGPAFSAVPNKTMLIQEQQTPTTDYTDNKLGLAFAHPTTWILENSNPARVGKNGKKGKKAKGDDSVHFRLPLTGAVEDADLVIMRAEFSGSPETWQQVQADANKDLKRNVDKQWDQEILGVPLLLTRISYSENGNAKTTVTGLLYNDATNKLLFRLTGPSADFDKAQFEFTNAMQTLRTINNSMPKVQDPDHPSAAPVDTKGLKHTLFAPPPPPKPILAPVAIPVVVSTKNVLLRVPRGWKAEHIDGNGLDLRTSELPYPVHIRLFSVLDSDPAGVALSKAAALSLADFASVATRHDTPLDANLADCVVTSVLRDGSSAKGRLMSYDACGKSGDFYFIASCAPKSGETIEAQKKALARLLDYISIEPTGS